MKTIGLGNNMDDVVLIGAVIFSVGLLVLAIRIYELRHMCNHTWGLWIQSETDHAYVQQRLCSKCGVAETQQFRKMGPEKCEKS